MIEEMCDICGKSGAVSTLRRGLVLHEDCLVELDERQHDYQERFGQPVEPDRDVA